MDRFNGCLPSRASARTRAAAWWTPLCADQSYRQVSWRGGQRDARSAEVRQLTAGAGKDRAAGDVEDYTADHVDRTEARDKAASATSFCHRALIDLGARRRPQRVTLCIVKPVFAAFFADRLCSAPGQLHDRDGKMNDLQRRIVGPRTLHQRLGRGGNLTYAHPQDSGCTASQCGTRVAVMPAAGALVLRGGPVREVEGHAGDDHLWQGHGSGRVLFLVGECAGCRVLPVRRSSMTCTSIQVPAIRLNRPNSSARVTAQ